MNFDANIVSNLMSDPGNGSAARMGSQTGRAASANRAASIIDLADSNSSQRVDFKSKFEEVVRSNMKAKFEPRQVSSQSRRQTVAEVADRPLTSRVRTADSVRNVIAETPEIKGTKPVEKTGTDEEKKTEATDALAAAVVGVGEILKVKISDGIYHLDLQNPSDTSVKEISEIVATLKGIVSVIEDSVKTGESLDLNGVLLNPQQLADTAQQLKQQIFKIEFAVNALGIAGKVNEQVAQLLNQNGDGGIAQAIDPASRQMAAAEVDQLLNKSAKTDTNQVHKLLEKLAAIIKENAPQNPTGDMQISVKTALAPQATAQVGPAVFDSKTLRTVLKVDSAASTANENTQAAIQTDKMDLPKTMNVVFGRGLGDELSNRLPVESVLNIQGASQKSGESTPFTATKLLQTPAFTPETAVMNQVSEKFSHALRTGLNEVKILLKPEALGEVRLKIQIEGDIVMARITVENQQVKQIIESSLTNLKNSLAEHNLQAGAFNVDVGDTGHKDLRDGRESVLNGGAGDRDGSEQSETAATAPVAGTPDNVDTGRRFGSNSIEFFA